MGTVAYAIGLISKADKPALKVFTETEIKHRKFGNAALVPNEPKDYPPGATGGMEAILTALLECGSDDFEITELHELHEILNGVSTTNMWEIEKVLESSQETIQALREGPKKVRKCSEDLHIEDRFHQWVESKLGAKVEQVNRDVVDSQAKLYSGFIKVTSFMWEEPLDALTPLEQPAMHMVQRVLSNVADLVSCVCSTFTWMQKEQALEHGRKLTGAGRSREAESLRPSDTLAARAGQQISRAKKSIHINPSDKPEHLVDVVKGALSANKAIKAIAESGQALTEESIQQINRGALPEMQHRAPDSRTLRHGWGLVRKTLKGKSFFDKNSEELETHGSLDMNAVLGAGRRANKTQDAARQAAMALDVNMLDDLERLEQEKQSK